MVHETKSNVRAFQIVSAKEMFDGKGTVKWKKKGKIYQIFEKG